MRRTLVSTVVALVAIVFAGVVTAPADAQEPDPLVSDPLVSDPLVSDPLVVVWVVDGMQPSKVDAAHMPGLQRYRDGEDPRVSSYVWHDASAVMVSETYPNHTSMLTGAPGDVHGIVANTVWDGYRFRSASPDLLRAETLVDRIETERPDLETALVMADPGLYTLFREEPADTIWNPRFAFPRLPIFDYAFDSVTVDATIGRIDSGADFVFVNTQGVDFGGHWTGPDSSFTTSAIAEADRQLTRLVGHLQESGRWDDTVLLVVSDHDMVANRAMTSVEVALLLQLIFGWRTTTSSGVALLAKPGGATPAEVARVKDAISAMPGVAEVHATGGELARRHPDWRIDDPRAGDVVAVADPGWSFLSPIPGIHGHPLAMPSTMLMLGPPERVRRGENLLDPAGNMDVAATVAQLLGVGVPTENEGRVLGEALMGE